MCCGVICVEVYGYCIALRYLAHPLLIENVWNLLKNRLDRRIPKPNGADAMKDVILEEWNGISTAEILGFVDSMLECIAAVITAHGRHARWWYGTIAL
jgi:hypothetical protein